MFSSSPWHCPQWLLNLVHVMLKGGPITRWSCYRSQGYILPSGSCPLVKKDWPWESFGARRHFPSKPLLALLWPELGHMANEPVTCKEDGNVLSVRGPWDFQGISFLHYRLSCFISLKPWPSERDLNTFNYQWFKLWCIIKYNRERWSNW